MAAGQKLDMVYSFSADRAGQGALEMGVKDVKPSPSGGRAP